MTTSDYRLRQQIQETLGITKPKRREKMALTYFLSEISPEEKKNLPVKELAMMFRHRMPIYILRACEIINAKQKEYYKTHPEYYERMKEKARKRTLARYHKLTKEEKQKIIDRQRPRSLVYYHANKELIAKRRHDRYVLFTKHVEQEEDHYLKLFGGGDEG